ncbi:MAG: Gfo/Idh/MocA family oxidoreductase, partial [Acidobacteria bacterium]|nr:Gfo/Idh/MocA family oxidoreductase [Acidobacteriota bacterium]
MPSGSRCIPKSASPAPPLSTSWASEQARVKRREFTGGGAALAAAGVLGANDAIGVGLIGAGGRGRYLTGAFKEAPGVEIRAVSDIYEPNLRKGLEAAGAGARPYHDYRDLLASRAIDAVIVATPDHWHAQMTIDAVNAGKDVYVEKPMCHTIAEGFQVIEAARRNRRVVQVGTQRRSYDLFLGGKKVMDSGKLGPVKLVNAWWYNYAGSVRQGKLEGKLDWERWLGSAARRPLDPHRFFNWYYFWDYSGGLMVGQAAHVVDAIHWYMNSTYPLAVTCAGGKPHLEGVEVPETTTMVIEYPEDYLAVFTVGYRAMRYNAANDQMKQFHGSKARFDVGRESWALYPESREIDMKP